MAPKKINIKERITDGEIDLSMSDLQEVPVKEIAIYKKAFSLDLSNNHLKTLPPNFATLTHLTKLDLSKNELKELPENFGDLVKLKYLDLYQNQLQYLPLSFSKLKALKWLDLKDNPLVPAVAKVSGPCLDAKQCQSCARDVVNFFVQVQEQIANDIEVRQKQRQRQLEVNQQTKQSENKKSKKKEKSKQKQQNGPIKENVVKQNMKKAKKSQKIENVKSNNSICLMLFLWFLFGISALFVLTSIDCKYTRLIQSSVENVFNEGVSRLPKNYQDYCFIFAEYFRNIHIKTGNVTSHVINVITDKKIYEHIYSRANELKDTIQNKSKEFYQHYVAS